MDQSALQLVGSIPELLELIFNDLDPTSNANNAVVCKLWSEVARDTLWREVSDPRRLLSILAPISILSGVSSMATVRANRRLFTVFLRTSRGDSSRRIGLAS